MELSDEIQLPQTGENLPQIQSQKCSWIWYVIHTLTILYVLVPTLRLQWCQLKCIILSISHGATNTSSFFSLNGFVMEILSSSLF